MACGQRGVWLLTVRMGRSVPMTVCMGRSVPMTVLMGRSVPIQGVGSRLMA